MGKEFEKWVEKQPELYTPLMGGFTSEDVYKGMEIAWKAALEWIRSRHYIKRLISINEIDDELEE
uniref:Uncharacterized protein n=1 Tax=viral metagenome TaxID=1070528 RepID=A0A6M3XZC1_9ZZZZ